MRRGRAILELQHNETMVFSGSRDAPSGISHWESGPEFLGTRSSRQNYAGRAIFIGRGEENLRPVTRDYLERSFFERDPLVCARALIGRELVWDGSSGIVVETEAYSAIRDEACHTFLRPSARQFVASYSAGSAYVYLNYGMYWLLNVLIKGGSEDGFVLIRAIEPTSGVDTMRERRGVEKLDTALCSGPGKLAQALGVTGADHGLDLCGAGTERGFRAGHCNASVISDVRVGITKSAHLQWRFLLEGSRFVSVNAGRVKPLRRKARRA